MTKSKFDKIQKMTIVELRNILLFEKKKYSEDHFVIWRALRKKRELRNKKYSKNVYIKIES